MHLSVLMISTLMLSQQSNELTILNSELQAELACPYGLLERKFSNDHDARYIYISVTLKSILLTLFIIKK